MAFVNKHAIRHHEDKQYSNSYAGSDRSINSSIHVEGDVITIDHTAKKSQVRPNQSFTTSHRHPNSFSTFFGDVARVNIDRSASVLSKLQEQSAAYINPTAESRFRSETTNLSTELNKHSARPTNRLVKATSADLEDFLNTVQVDESRRGEISKAESNMKCLTQYLPYQKENKKLQEKTREGVFSLSCNGEDSRNNLQSFHPPPLCDGPLQDEYFTEVKMPKSNNFGLHPKNKTGGFFPRNNTNFSVKLNHCGNNRQFNLQKDNWSLDGSQANKAGIKITSEETRSINKFGTHHKHAAEIGKSMVATEDNTLSIDEIINHLDAIVDPPNSNRDKKNNQASEIMRANPSAKMKTSTKEEISSQEETENRLAMELPRHNWLVKHLIKNNKLIEPGTERVTPAAASPASAVNSNDKNASSAVINFNDTTQVTTSSVSTNGTEIIAAKITSTPTLAVCTTTEGQHNMIGIVKPFQHPIEDSSQFLPKSRQEASSNIINPDIQQHEAKFSLGEKIVAGVLDCSTSSLSDVKIESCFSLAKPRLKIYNKPLDLTINSVVVKGSDALDLSSKSEKSCTGEIKKPTSCYITSEASSDDPNSPKLATSSSSSNEQTNVKLPINYFSTTIATASAAIKQSRVMDRENHTKSMNTTIHKKEKVKTTNASSFSDNLVVPEKEKSCRNYFPSATTKVVYCKTFLSATTNAKSSPSCSSRFKSSSSIPQLKSSKALSTTARRTFLQTPKSTSDFAKNIVKQDSCEVIDVDALEDNLPAVKSRPKSKCIVTTKSASFPLNNKIYTKAVSNRRFSHQDIVSSSLLSTKGITGSKMHYLHHTPQLQATNPDKDRVRTGIYNSANSTVRMLPSANMSYGKNKTMPPTSGKSRYQAMFCDRNRLVQHKNTRDGFPMKTVALEHHKLSVLPHSVYSDTPMQSHSPIVNLASQYNNDKSCFSVSHNHSDRRSLPTMALTSPRQLHSTASPAFTLRERSFKQLPGSLNLSSDANGFRVPVKPIPMHSQHLLVPHTTVTAFHPESPTPLNIDLSYSRVQPQSHHSVTRQSGTFPELLGPRSGAIRAPPGGVAINSTPIQSLESSINNISSQVRPNTSYRSSLPNAILMNKSMEQSSFKLFSPSENKELAAQLEVQKMELEEKIQKLRLLENKMRCDKFYQRNNNQTFQINSIKQTFGNSMSHSDAKKRKNEDPYLHIRTPQNIDLHQSQRLHVADKTPRMNFQNMKTTVSNMYALKDEKCVICPTKAYFVCSGCRNVWYCSKFCQFQHWAAHSKVCM